MSWFFTPHSRARFEERYGFRPSFRDMSIILTACNAGRAVPMRTNGEGGNAYCFDLRGTRVFPIIKDGIIITFLPPDFFFASQAKAHRREALNAAGRPAKGPEAGKGIKNYLRRPPYKRDRTPAAKLVEEA